MGQSGPTTALGGEASDEDGENPAALQPKGTETTAAKAKRRHAPEAPRAVIARLLEDGWFDSKKGKGDHRNFKHPTKTGKVTVDVGVNEIPVGTLRSLYRQAGWPW